MRARDFPVFLEHLRGAYAQSIVASIHARVQGGITTYLQNGGTIEHAQQIANHESPRTTKLYDRTNDAISLDEIERILNDSAAFLVLQGCAKRRLVVELS